MGTCTEDEDTTRSIKWVKAGHDDEYAVVYRRYFDRAYRYARTIIRDAHEAEDVTQEAFLRAFEALDSYDPDGAPFRAWLFRIVHNVALRRAERARRLCPTHDPHDGPAAAGPSPQVDGLDALLAGLPLSQRQVLLLRFRLDLSPAETARVLDRSPEAVRQLQRRAIATLRARMCPPAGQATADTGPSPVPYSFVT